MPKGIPTDINKWLNLPPRKSDIAEIKTGADTTIKIIPEKIVESMLDEMTGQNWDTVKFQSYRFIDATKSPAVILMDASLELIVKYKGKDGIDVIRTLVGAVTFDTAFFNNTHHNNTAKSLCISNAASDLGKRFGKDLNPSVAVTSNVPMGAQSKILNTLAKKCTCIPKAFGGTGFDENCPVHKKIG